MRFPLLAAALPAALFCAAAAWAEGGLSLPDSAAFFSLDGKTGVAVVDPLGRRALAGRVEGSRPGPFSPLSGVESPAALASDETGLLLAVDRGPKGYFLKKFRNLRAEGQPVELAVAPKRGVVGAAARSGILWLVLRNPAGLLVAAYDGQTLAEPAGLDKLCVSPFSVALDPSGRAYVTDPMGPALFVFSASGNFESRVELKGSGFTRPSGVAADAAGAVFVSDGVTGRVARYRPENRAEPLEPLPGHFEDPLRLFADPRGTPGLWVVESRPGRLTRMEESKR